MSKSAAGTGALSAIPAMQREADMLAQAMPADMPLRQRRWLGLQMLEGDIQPRLCRQRRR